jgi:hypothetical protein
MPVARERRQHARQVVSRPCTVFRRRTQRFVGARTVDISPGGALVEVTSPRPLVEGETIDVGVAWTSSPVISGQSLVEAKVVRIVEQRPGVQTVAVRFDHADVLAAVA